MVWKFQYAWPSGEQWKDLIFCLIGALAGWLTHPLCWLVAGPVRWVCLIAMTASGESAFIRDIAGDDGASVGILQFNVGNDSIPLDKRTDPLWSGWGAAVNVQTAIWNRPMWAPYLACPIIGPAWFRALWYGPGSIDTMTTAEAWERWLRPELPRAFSAWWVWRTLTLPLAFLVTAAFLASIPSKVWKGAKWRR